jgi:hypothetical protein
MLRRTDPIAPMGWGMPHPAMQRPGRLAERTRWLWLVPLVVGFLTVFGWVASHDPGKGLVLSRRGWATTAAAAVLMWLISVHRNDGFGHLVRMVAEYAVVAVLAVLVVTAASTAQGPAALEARARAQALSCLWHQASEAAKDEGTPSTTTTPRGGR